MAKTNAPLLSMGGAGQIGKTMVHASWRGVPYVRKYVMPANPNTANQQKTRSVFSWLNAAWKLLAADAQAPWTANAAGRPYTNRNQWIKSNLPDLRSGTDLSTLIGSPGALGGLAPAAMSVDGGSGDITVTFTVPSLPTGWSIAKSVAVAFGAGDPHDSISAVSHTATADADPWTVTIDSLDAGDYEVAGWFEITRSDGRTAYGPSLSDTATVS